MDVSIPDEIKSGKFEEAEKRQIRREEIDGEIACLSSLWADAWEKNDTALMKLYEDREALLRKKRDEI
jgi:hypothetical protein